MKLFSSHLTQLRKVLVQLNYNQKMNCTQIILSNDNKNKVKEAADLIAKAMVILQDIN